MNKVLQALAIVGIACVVIAIMPEGLLRFLAGFWAGGRIAEYLTKVQNP